MADFLVQFLKASLPEELAESLTPILSLLEKAEFESIFKHEDVRNLLGHDEDDELLKDVFIEHSRCWSDYIFDRLAILLRERQNTEFSKGQENSIFLQHVFFITGLAALGAFLQSNATGPPLPFSSPNLLFPHHTTSNSKRLSNVRQKLLQSLGADGEAAYKLTPNVELFCLASAIMTYPPILKNIAAAKWAKVRVDFLHQRLLSGIAPSLQKSIYDDLDSVAEFIMGDNPNLPCDDIRVTFLLERAAIHTHHGFDKLAKADLDLATKERGFEFALTGLLGKRTKYQQTDVSQLVVLARSADGAEQDSKGGTVVSQGTTMEPNGRGSGVEQPKALVLDDDTLLESISFTRKPKSSVDPQESSELSPQLASLDPEKQPILHPLDSIILLSLAASITNTSPSHGLTREETLPYATRVLEGGSSNWQVYTQALLLRSRIEGYKSRTVERGLLQLQALVDQVIADTASSEGGPNSAATFLPRSKESESAPANQRLLFIYQLCSSTRWELEAELAARWVNLGGLRSALEIYERLEMWPEAALCWAATDRDDKARKVVRKQLFHSTNGDDQHAEEDTEMWKGPSREPPPADGPRLYCILADIDKDPSLFEKAWEVSNGRYARAQRSLGKHYYGERDYAKASLAFSKALEVKQLDHPTWFALGCALLELGQFKRAVEAFSRAVQLDDTDAEAWSNLAAALLNLEPETTQNSAIGMPSEKPAHSTEDEEDLNLLASATASDPQQHARDALKAFKQAARLKHHNHRIWENLLTVSASLTPPSWSDILVAQRRIVELRGTVDGERCIDVKIVSALVEHVMSTFPPEDMGKPGLPRMVVQLFDISIVPLITASAPLWHLVAKLSLLRGKPSAALDAHEKAWRAVTTQPGWEYGTETQWNAVVDATADLIDAYQSLGPMERTEGLAGGSGLVVMKDWRFKGRSAARGIMGRGKENWEGSDGWERLRDVLEGLKG